MADDCIFCKIIKGEIPSTKVYEDDKMIAINDVAPAAPVHVLLMPKDHTCNHIAIFAVQVCHDTRGTTHHVAVAKCKIQCTRAAAVPCKGNLASPHHQAAAVLNHQEEE